MKKYLLLIEDERIWEKFKGVIAKDINTEKYSINYMEEKKYFSPNFKSKNKSFVIH